MKKIIITLLNGAKNGKLTMGSINRIEEAIRHSSDESVFIMSTGWPLSKKAEYRSNFYTQITEAGLAKEYLIKRGFLPENILVEKYSGDTIGNIFFSFNLIVNYLNIENIIIVSSDYHLPRIKEIVSWYQDLNIIKKTAIKFSSPPIEKYGSIENIEFEKNKIINVLKLKNEIKNHDDLIRFIFQKHDFYNK